MKTVSEAKITAQHFRVANFDGLSEFYCDLLGMKEISTTDGSKSFRFCEGPCPVVFHEANVDAYQPYANDFYWKIGVTLHDLDAAVLYLRDQGATLPDPYQFKDIGYMSKLTDPNGFPIELLQQGFEGRPQPVLEGHPVGAQATLAHITLRVTDINSAKAYFDDNLGMRLMSIQPVEDFGFCLYFYSWSDETLPDPDLKSVNNREWLWARPYTFIELQHLENPRATTHQTALSQSGFAGFSYRKEIDENAIFVCVSDLSHLS